MNSFLIKSIYSGSQANEYINELFTREMLDNEIFLFYKHNVGVCIWSTPVQEIVWF